jgi:hypothetical protein
VGVPRARPASAGAVCEGDPVSWPGSVCPGRRMARHPVSGHGGVAVSFGGSPGGRSSPRREVRDLDHLVSLRQVCAPRRHGAAAGRTSLALDTRDLARVPAPPARPTPPERWRCAHDNARRLSKSGGRQSHALRKTAPVGAWGHRRVPASQGDRCHSTQEGPHGASPDDGIPVRWRPPNRVGTGGTPVLGESSETSARSVGSHPDDGPSLRPSPGCVITRVGGLTADEDARTDARASTRTNGGLPGRQARAHATVKSAATLRLRLRLMVRKRQDGRRAGAPPLARGLNGLRGASVRGLVVDREPMRWWSRTPPGGCALHLVIRGDGTCVISVSTGRTPPWPGSRSRSPSGCC